MNKTKKRGRKVYPVTVDYSKSLAEMFMSCRFDVTDSKLDEFIIGNFSVDDNSQKNVRLHITHFERHIDNDDIVIKLNNRGLRPATLPEMLAFWRRYPQFQRKFVILALGSKLTSCDFIVGIHRDLFRSEFEDISRGWGLFTKFWCDNDREHDWCYLAAEL